MKIFSKNLKIFPKGYKIEFLCKIGLFGLGVKAINCMDKLFFKNCKMAKDYAVVAKWPSRKSDYAISERINGTIDAYNCYKIYTIYDNKIRRLNWKFRKYCNKTGCKYYPYKLYIIKKDICYYHLHTDGNYIEFYNKFCLKELVNKFETYINGLMTVDKPAKEIKKSGRMSKIEEARQQLIDAEIDRSYEHIKVLKKLKK